MRVFALNFSISTVYEKTDLVWFYEKLLWYFSSAFDDRIKTLTCRSLVVRCDVRRSHGSMNKVNRFDRVTYLDIASNRSTPLAFPKLRRFNGQPTIPSSNSKQHRRSNGHPTIPSSNSKQLRCSNGLPTAQSSSSKDPIPSAYYRKGKRRQDIHPTKSL